MPHLNLLSGVCIAPCVVPLCRADVFQGPVEHEQHHLIRHHYGVNRRGPAVDHSCGGHHRTQEATAAAAEAAVAAAATGAAVAATESSISAAATTEGSDACRAAMTRVGRR